MSEEEKKAINYRFGGYQPPLIQLDSTGAAYWLKIESHPYYTHQPSYWKGVSFRYIGARHFGNVNSQEQLDSEADQQTSTQTLRPFIN